MMNALPLGLVIEGAVAVLLALTIGYCVVLNARLKRLHADRETLRQMVADLVGATELANRAIKELKQSAVEADGLLGARLQEAERFGIELANHVNAGTVLMERIARITSVAQERAAPESRLGTALERLAARERARSSAA